MDPACHFFGGKVWAKSPKNLDLSPKKKESINIVQKLVLLNKGFFRLKKDVMELQDQREYFDIESSPNDDGDYEPDEEDDDDDSDFEPVALKSSKMKADAKRKRKKKKRKKKKSQKSGQILKIGEAALIGRITNLNFQQNQAQQNLWRISTQN